jgi:hypothetical protein
MLGRWALLLGLLWLVTGAPLKAEPLPAGDVTAAAAPVARRQRLHDCVQRASPRLRGIEALRAACPEIGTDLEDLGLDALLPEDWKARVSPRAVADLTMLADRYALQSAHVPPSASRLQSIARLLEPAPSSVSWWQRLRSWIASWLGSDRNRWPDWLRSLANWRSGRIILLFGSIALVLAATVAVIVIELRAAGRIGARRQPRLPKRPVMAAGNIDGPSISLADVEAAPESLRPAILLRLLVSALTRSRRLDRDSVMTCRELITAARFDNTAQHEIFASVALLAERVVYGDPRGVPAPPNPDLLASAGGLYRELVEVPAQQTTA